jgi:hypothetical protein
LYNIISAITSDVIAEIRYHGIADISIPSVGRMLANVLMITTNAATDEAVPNLLAHIVSEAVTKISEALHGYHFVETLISQYLVS